MHVVMPLGVVLTVRRDQVQKRHWTKESARRGRKVGKRRDGWLIKPTSHTIPYEEARDREACESTLRLGGGSPGQDWLTRRSQHEPVQPVVRNTYRKKMGGRRGGEVQLRAHVLFWDVWDGLSTRDKVQGAVGVGETSLP